MKKAHIILPLYIYVDGCRNEVRQGQEVIIGELGKKDVIIRKEVKQLNL